MKRFMIAAAAAYCLTAGVAQAATTVGNNNISTCLPFGCPDGNGLTAVQQIYASSQFAGVQSIGSVSFIKSLPGGTLGNETFNLSFYTSSKAVNGLSTNLASNLGTLLADFGTFTISGAAPDVLTFASATAFNYNPALGNLLMQITYLSEPSGGSGAFYQGDLNGTVTRRAVGSSYGNFLQTSALVTTFSSATAAPTAAVPEPATWLMLIGGFALVGGALRRRQQDVSVRYAY